jgi:hypothetical protein
MTKSDAPLISAGEHSAFLLSGVSASEAANLPPRTIPSLHRRRVHFVAFLAETRRPAFTRFFDLPVDKMFDPADEEGGT